MPSEVHDVTYILVLRYYIGVSGVSFSPVSELFETWRRDWAQSAVDVSGDVMQASYSLWSRYEDTWAHDCKPLRVAEYRHIGREGLRAVDAGWDERR
jgi:hypothetical protein